MICVVCNRDFAWSGRGRRPSVCGQRCSKRKQRRQSLPVELTRLRRWTCRDGKRPVMVDGRPASSTKGWTWTDYASVADKPHGVMLGGGLACYDLDGVLEGDQLHPDAAAVLESVEPVWVERSLSGRGLHVFVWGDGPTIVGERVSYYSEARFIAVTGQPWQ